MRDLVARLVSLRSLPRWVAVVTAIATVGLASESAAQYTVQELLPPSGFPATMATRAFAINNQGQVFGETLSSTVRQPVLWTNGLPDALPIPAGYYWEDAPVHQFLNERARRSASSAFRSRDSRPIHRVTITASSSGGMASPTCCRSR